MLLYTRWAFWAPHAPQGNARVRVLGDRVACDLLLGLPLVGHALPREPRGACRREGADEEEDEDYGEDGGGWAEAVFVIIYCGAAASVRSRRARARL